MMRIYWGKDDRDLPEYDAKDAEAQKKIAEALSLLDRSGRGLIGSGWTEYAYGNMQFLGGYYWLVFLNGQNGYTRSVCIRFSFTFEYVEVYLSSFDAGIKKSGSRVYKSVKRAVHHINNRRWQDLKLV